MDLSKVLILIPSRYESSRFPGKSLSVLTPKNSPPVTLVEMVYMNCAQTGYDVAVVTDNELIEARLKSSEMQVIRVDDDVVSGTERIALAHERFFKKKYQLIINVQGDEPLLESEDLKKLVSFHEKNSFHITTLIKPQTEKEELSNPNVVKVALSEKGQCLYFSRSPIPYERNKNSTWYQHIGVYCYDAEALKSFVKLPVSSLEQVESLEQLRALENGMLIGAVKTDSILMGVDTPEDLEKVNHYLQNKGSKDE